MKRQDAGDNAPPGPAGPGAKRDQPDAGARPALLAAAVGRSLHERIVNTVGEWIVGGVYPERATLPTEVELCARLGVSRSALREAFKLLAHKGLIASRQKVGTIVRPRADWNMLDPQLLAWEMRLAADAEVGGQSMVDQLFAVRMIVEPAAASLAAARQDRASLVRVGHALADMKEAREGRADLLDADLRFHQSILNATGNRFLMSFGAVIGNALVASFRLSWRAAQQQRMALEQHEAVLRAIEDGEAERARALMATLLERASGDAHEALSVAAPSGKDT